MSPPTARASASRNLSTASVAAAPALQPTWWIANRSWDTTFFLGSLATGVLLTVIALAAPSLAIPATIVAGILLANTHNLVTGFFFLDPENLAYYRKFPHYYFTVPLALLGAAMGITVAAPVLAFILHVFFTNWHVIRQSVGIQKLYLGRAKTSDTDRNLDATLIYAGGVILNAFALWKFGVLSGTSPLATVETHAAVAFPTGGAVALLGAVLAARVLWLGWRAGRVAWQRLGFGLTGIAMYSPYLVLDNFACAFMACLLPHYMQYHGIFWLVGQNKYTGNPRYADSWVGRLAKDFRVWIGLVLLAACAMALLRAPHFLAEKSPALLAAYRTPVFLTLGAFYGLGWMHFYLDGLLFRFRYPEVRAAILRYLRDPRLR